MSIESVLAVAIEGSLLNEDLEQLCWPPNATLVLFHGQCLKAFTGR